MLSLLIFVYVLVHQYINFKFASGFVGKRYAIYNLITASCVLILFLIIKMLEQNNDIFETLLFIIFLITYNLVSVFFKAKWSFNFEKEKKLSKEYLIYGTSKASRKILSLLIDEADIRVVGYVATDDRDVNKFINNVKCVCNLGSLENYVQDRAISIIVPIEDISAEDYGTLVDIARRQNLRFIPIKLDVGFSLKTLQSNKIPDLTPEDILKSKSGKFIEEEREKFKNKVILVVGGAGSIGSAIVDQLLNLETKKIICYDISETAIYNMSERLNKSYQDLSQIVEFRIGCMGDSDSVSALIDCGVEIVINAAAYKHVPICEENINACLQNNVINTHELLKLVNQRKVELFIQISTDKAVRPTNVMGVTKRIAELLIIHYQQISKNTKFHVVRFGNVLGSSGSVFHLFVDQIKRGGPVTVTDPEITRYLMTIEDAARLVLKSISLDQEFAINFLDMGQPVKISDLADRMIVAHGRMVATAGTASLKDMSIEKKFVGLRPGEKLYEELSHENDSKPTSIEGVLSVQVKSESDLSLDKLLTTIEKCIHADNEDSKKRLLTKVVSDYIPS